MSRRPFRLPADGPAPLEVVSHGRRGSGASARLTAGQIEQIRCTVQRTPRYFACYSAIHIALELSPASVDGAYRQAMEFARAISGVKPMQLVREAPGSLPITDEKAGVVRVPIKIDGHQGGAMLDTGASFSTISLKFLRLRSEVSL